MGTDLRVKKHSALIQLSGNTLGVVQKKAFLGLLYFARAQKISDPSRSMFEIPYCSLKEVCNITSPNNKELHSHLEGLMGIVVRPNYLNKDKKSKWNAFSLLSGAQEGDNGNLIFSFPFQIENSLISPEIYSLINMSTVSKLTNKYALTLYELLYDYRNAKFPKISIVEFRDLMGINKNKYPTFKELNKFVIKKSVDEINNKVDDIRVSFSFEKEGRRVSYIIFNVEDISNKKDIVDELVLSEDVIKAIEELSLNKGVAYHASLVNKYLMGDKGTVIAIDKYLNDKNLVSSVEDKITSLNKKIGSKIIINNQEMTIHSFSSNSDNSILVYLIDNGGEMYNTLFENIKHLI